MNDNFYEDSRKAFDIVIVNMLSGLNNDFSFYGVVLSKCKINFDESVPTAGVWYKDEKYNLVIGKKFIEWSLDEQVAVMVHEAKHILNFHHFRRKDRDFKLFNKACDIAINQTIKNLPKDALYPSQYNFPENLNAESYYDLLEEHKKQNPGSGDSDDSFIDDHTIWKEIDSSDSNNEYEVAKAITNKIITDAISEARGSLPADIEKLLKIFKEPSKISWKKEIRKYLSSVSSGKIPSIKRRDRRQPHRMDLKGKKKSIDKRKIVVCIDTSASVSDNEIIKALNEIDEVSKINREPLKIIQVDTEVKEDNISYYSKKEPNFIRKGYGGTYMASAIEYLLKNKEKPDLVIFISDMEIENVQTDKIWKEWERTRKPVLWLSTRGVMPHWSKKVKKMKVISLNKA